MSHRSDARLLVLHGLRLKGIASADSVAVAVGLSVASVLRELGALVAEGLTVRRSGLAAGWSLTEAGCDEHERVVTDELEAVGARPTVESGYRRFRSLNSDVLDACSRWQVRHVGGQAVRNDHSDPRHDAGVLVDLGTSLQAARPIAARLAAKLDRFGPYAPQLEKALERATAGEIDYVAKPLIPSFHTVWFEWHQDLLVTLGIDRSAETEGVL
jgi:hypothetical protein